MHLHIETVHLKTIFLQKSNFASFDHICSSKNETEVFRVKINVTEKLFRFVIKQLWK